MKWESFNDEPKARKAANALAVVVGLGILSVWLEWKAQWPADRIFASLVSFVIVATAVLLRLASRGRIRGETDELWITALWGWLVGGFTRVIRAIAARNASREADAEPTRGPLLLPRTTTRPGGHD